MCQEPWKTDKEKELCIFLWWETPKQHKMSPNRGGSHRGQEVRSGNKTCRHRSALRFLSRDPESVSPCPVCGLTFPICQVGMDSNSSLHQRGTNELTWATQPMEDTAPQRKGDVCTAAPRCCPHRGAASSGACPMTEDPEVAAGPWGRASLTTADGRVCNDRSLTPLVRTGD